MAFNDLQQKTISQFTVFTAHKNLAKLQLFSHTFTELEGQEGESIAVPVYDLSAASAFNVDTNNYGSGTNGVGGMLINLDQHLIKSVAITDKQLAFTGISWARDTAIALTDSLTRGINSYVFGLINESNVSLTATFDATSKNVVANLYAVAESNDLPVDKCVVVLNPAQYSKVLGLVDYSMVGTGDYLTTGVINNLFGFKGFVCSSNLPAGNKGCIILDEAMGIASKYLAPMTPDAYPEAWPITDEESGMTIGARRFMDLNKGTNNFAMDVLFGAKLLQPNKVIRLV